jgi:cation/acetate symporter
METHTFLAAEASTSTSRTLTIVLFLIFVAITLGITVWASRQTKTATDFYAGGRQFSGFQNGMAISGDYMSAASFLGIAGLIALFGYDGFLYSIGFLVAWLVALLLVAEYLRNSGRYTMADVLAFRMRQRPVRAAGSVSTITVSIFYLIAQMVGAGALVSLLLGIKPGTTFLGMDAATAKVATIILVGALMIIYVTVGGMKGTTYVQIVKAFMLMSGALLMTVLVLAHYKFNLSNLLGDAAAQSGKGDAFLEPGLRYGVEKATAIETFYSKMDLFSLGIALVLGTAGLPHILTRFYTVPTSRIARKSVLWAIAIIGTFYLLTLALGFGAACTRGQQGDHRTGQGGQHGRTAACANARRGLPRRRHRRRGAAGGHRGGGVRDDSRGGRRADAGVLVERRARLLRQRDPPRHRIGTGRGPGRPDRGPGHRCGGDRAVDLRAESERGIPGSAGVRRGGVGQPAGDPVQPVLAAVQHLGRVVGHLRRPDLGRGPGVLLTGRVGLPTAMFPDSDWHWFPLSNPGIISIPLGFLCGWIGTVLSKEDDIEKYAELEVRSLTGYGAH